MGTTDLNLLTGGQTLLILAARPGDESAACGLLIAEACARGRPPLVAVLTDGACLGAPGLSADARAAAHARETRAAVRALKLPPDRLLLLGVHDGTVPADGAFFERLVEAIGFLTWMRDLNVICSPCADALGAGAIAAEVARRCGIGRLSYGTSGDGVDAAELDASRHAAAKARAVAAHVSLGLTEAKPERYVIL